MKYSNFFQINSKCLCRQKNIKKIIKISSAKDHETNLGKFSIFFCTICKVGFTSPIIKRKYIYLLYKKKNTSDYDFIKNNFIDYIKDFQSVNLLKKISKNINVNSFLDFGTGNGRFTISAFKTFKNANIVSVDFFKKNIFKNISKKITYQHLKKFEKTKKKFDIIFLRHVIEHYHDPVRLLKKLKKRLNKKGIIYIEVPNLDSGTARIFKDKWKLYYLPRHIFHFTDKSLKKLFLLAGLKSTINNIEMPIMGNMFAYYFNLKNDKLISRIMGILLHPIQMLIEYYFRSSTCLNAICKKK